MRRQPDTADEYRRGLIDAARIADLYATENFRLAQDTILTDPFLNGRDVSAAALEVSARLQEDGCIYTAMARAAENIARAIRDAADE